MFYVQPQESKYHILILGCHRLYNTLPHEYQCWAGKETLYATLYIYIDQKTHSGFKMWGGNVHSELMK